MRTIGVRRTVRGKWKDIRWPVYLRSPDKHLVVALSARRFSPSVTFPQSLASSARGAAVELVDLMDRQVHDGKRRRYPGVHVDIGERECTRRGLIYPGQERGRVVASDPPQPPADIHLSVPLSSSTPE